MFHRYWPTFIDLIRIPFEKPELIWGIVPLYFGWLLNELTSSKASFRTAVQTGFSFIWAGTNWAYHYSHLTKVDFLMKGVLPVNVAVTILILLAGLVALVSGLRRRYPPGCSFLGHSRFGNYFMILIFPMQSNYLKWNWNQLGAIFVFAIPVWLLLHFGLKPFRK